MSFSFSTDIRAIFFPECCFSCVFIGSYGNFIVFLGFHALFKRDLRQVSWVFMQISWVFTGISWFSWGFHGFHRVIGGRSCQEALKLLKEGNGRWVSGMAVSSRTGSGGGKSQLTPSRLNFL